MSSIVELMDCLRATAVRFSIAWKKMFKFTMNFMQFDAVRMAAKRKNDEAVIQ